MPVAVYVAPTGTRTASAGTYILYASHIAAIAPGTNMGAATPVQIGGFSPDDIKKEKDKADKPVLDDSKTTLQRMGYTHFQMIALERVSAEMSLHVLAYNMKRVMRV